MRMTTWSTKSESILDDAVLLLRANGWLLSYTTGPQGINQFFTRQDGSDEWNEWDAEMGYADLAHLVALVLDLPVVIE